ncbi:MAG: putative Holliday junction resolvase [Candidatus Dependentiae bacterium ADurb.Bin331]|nr:MAG: putative Holliday junction resolvase [Candidatus Dependentiae bacterium ADurb.Bin331]
MKLLALDLGDQWTGLALSDILYLTARPHKTVPTHALQSTLQEIIASEKIKTIIIGLPITLRGTESAQTNKVQSMKKNLEQQFPAISWILWDERLTSKQATSLKKTRTKEEKLRSHAIAAAFILQSYLDYLQYQKNIAKEST